jgi:hypothetical protein
MRNRYNPSGFLRSRGRRTATDSIEGRFRVIGATGVTVISPRFDFTSGTVKVYIDSAYIKDLTSGVEDNIALSPGQTVDYIASVPNAVTRIDINGDKVSGDISGWVLPSSLVNFAVYNTSVSGNISGWVLPSSLVYFAVSNTSVSGDISGWVLPSSLVNFAVYNTSVSGNISGWVLPSSLVYFYVSSTSVSGDISGWVLPSSLVYFTVSSTSVSGDISGWVLPSSLVNFYVYTTSVSGDISGWVLPSSLVYFVVYTTALDYNATSGMFTTWPTGLTKIDFDNCSLTETQVDNVLADCVASGKSTKQLDLGDNNHAPSAAGLVNKATLETAGWTVKVTA